MTKLYTIGHSTHSIGEFNDILNSYKIVCLVDIHTIPKSLYVPQFNAKFLESNLKRKGIKYVHLSKLGGLRASKRKSINLGWKNTSFRGFADYMQTPEFYKGLKELNELLKIYKPLVIMCAEALPWRCHRSLIADAETVRKIEVFHIMSKTSLYQHKLTSFAVVNRKTRPITVYYPK